MHITDVTEFPILLIVGLIIVTAFYAGKAIKYIRLPSLVGFMLIGVIAGPSLFNITNEEVQKTLSFITEIALSFVAVSIGLELSFSSLKKQGSGIITIIFAESFAAFILVTLAIYLLTRNLPLALIFGSIAPASAPAGTVAVIREYRAKGSLTKALYAVVGFDDGLGIIIFGFAAAIARTIILQDTGESLFKVLSMPLFEIIGGIITGIIMAFLFCVFARRLKNRQDTFILIFGFVLATTGLCIKFHLSLILTNMILGMFIVNTQPHNFIHRIQEELSSVLPLLFVLFFTLAGANLHISAIPSLGVIGMVYILTRSAGLIAGSRIGAAFGKVEDKIKKYIGLGILSQAGVAIGLSLIVKHEFSGIGKIIKTVNGHEITSGDYLGTTVITTITAACIFFELIGPILTKIALTKAGEIEKE